MTQSTSRYPDNWKEIALLVKEQAKWQCRRCGQQCLKPSDDTSNLTLSERHKLTLPEDNRLENLIPLCSSCHLHYHYLGQGNVSPGQLSLFNSTTSK